MEPFFSRKDPGAADGLLSLCALFCARLVRQLFIGACAHLLLRGARHIDLLIIVSLQYFLDGKAILCSHFYADTSDPDGRWQMGTADMNVHDVLLT